MRGRDDYDILQGYYHLGETLGVGGFGKVKEAIHLATGQKVAIKIMDKASLGEDLPRVSREINILKTLSHPYICKLYQVIETDTKFFMVMEFCAFGELFDYIVQRDRLDEAEGRRLFRQIASAVAYIHGRGIAHRDLKPENILLDECNNVKLIDFGLCAAPTGGTNAKLETCCGSPAYAAPELVKGEQYIGPQADVWSLGVLLYALLNGFLPFDDPSLGVLYRKIQEGKYEEPKWLSEGAKNILRCMLQVNPIYRLSVDTLLKHTWCQQGKPEALPELDIKPYCPVLENDVLQKICSTYPNVEMPVLQRKLIKWDYASYDNATYLLLAQRKLSLGVSMFRKLPLRIDRQPSHTCPKPRYQKTLDKEYSETTSLDGGLDLDSSPINENFSPSRPYHASMEGGLDDCELLTLGSPKVENKENEATDKFIRPRLPTPKKPKLPEGLATSLSPARSADSGLNDVPRTPVREKWRNIGTPVKPLDSPFRRNVFGSIERGIDRVKLMLTPRSSKDKKKLRVINCTANANKGAFNVTKTASNDPDCVVTELRDALDKLGIESYQKGYSIIGKWFGDNGKQVKFALEVVAIETSENIGIRRKRHNGDSWMYKRIVEQILSLPGVCPLPAKKPKESLQTMV